MVRQWTGEDQSAFQYFHIAKHMILSSFSNEDTIGRLINSQSFMDNTFQIDHIFNRVVN